MSNAFLDDYLLMRVVQVVGSAMVSEGELRRKRQILALDIPVAFLDCRSKRLVDFFSPCTVLVMMGNKSVGLTASWVPEVRNYEGSLTYAPK